MRKIVCNSSAYKERLENTVYPLVHGRGFEISRYEIPVAIFQYLPAVRQEFDEFYQVLQRYSARLLLHDLFLKRPSCTLADLTHYCSESSVRRLLPVFRKFGIVGDWTPEAVPVIMNEVLNMGWLLEWFLGTLLSLEFSVPSIFNVGLRGTNIGGDYDILACWMSKLLYLETKSSPPRGIHNPEVTAFLQRVREIKPDIAIFLNDTHLRVKDKIVLMFEEEFIKLKGVQSLQTFPVERIEEQIFHIKHYLYITNSKRDIRQNLKVIFQDFLEYHLPSGEIF